MKRLLLVLAILAAMFPTIAGAIDALDATKPAENALISAYGPLLREERAAINSIIDLLPGAKSWKVVTSGATAVSGDFLLVDTSGGAVTVTLPAAPVAGSYVVLGDATGSWGTHNVTLGRNALKIAGNSADYALTGGGVVYAVYESAGYGWAICTINLSAPGAIGATTPAAGTFTALTASSITDSGLTASRVVETDGSKVLVSSAASKYELMASKSTDVALGSSDTLYPSQNAVKSYVGTYVGATAELVANKTTSAALGTSDTLYPSQKAVKSYADTGLALKEDVGNKTNSATLGTSPTYYPTQYAVKTYVDTTVAAYELLSNKSTTTTLGSSNTLYPTQLAVKTYVDTELLTPTTTSLTIGTDGTPLLRHYSTTALWNPGTVGDGAASVNTLMLSGSGPEYAALGDTVALAFPCLKSSDSSPVTGVILSGHVSSTNTVEIALVNHSGGSVTFKQGTLRVDIWHH